MLGLSAIATGSGLGLSLLGIAPFTPPNPFMFGLLLAVVQTRLAHLWMTRQLRAQTRRHVTEVVQTLESDDTLVVIMKCDGGLTRQLRLRPPTEGSRRVPFADLVKKGSTFTFFDNKKGTAIEPEAFEELLASSRVISTEKFTVTPFQEETQQEAERLTQRLSQLTAAHLQKIQGRDDVAPEASLGSLRQQAQLTGAVILTGGLLICLGGRYSAEKQMASMM